LLLVDMEDVERNGRKSFEGPRCFRTEHCNKSGRTSGELFETDWEVFVARFDRKTGKYVNLTFCCESAVN